MANPEHIKILRQGTKAWNDWRKHTPLRPDFSRADLSGVNLSLANLHGADFYEAYLCNANLYRADLCGAELCGADLTWGILYFANLSNADARGANLSGADLGETALCGADLSYANLSGTNLSGANLYQTNLSNTLFAETVLSNLDLKSVGGLECVEHRGPSPIDIRTLRKSWPLPPVFLRGCGLPDDLIEYLPSLLNQPIQFHTCFISHSAKDRLFCERIYNDLQGKGVRCWFFPEDATWGKPVWGEIDQSIRVYDKLVVVCSKNSLTSGPVLREIERALQKEDKTGKDVLFPITIDSHIFKKWEHPRKADVLAKVVGSFADWKKSPEAYGKSLKQLIRSLGKKSDKEKEPTS